jgi:2-polyprenyl-3-methyl-5-hydroxy-6-metoxy-1,4-benzoquinol methylase
MAKQGEIEYLQKVGEDGIRHAMGKPFTDHHCAFYLMEIGAVMAVLPPPPARLLDVGCGTGWTSAFFARRGYEVVGADIAADMIECANELRDREGLDNLSFVVSDYEDSRFDAEFDCAVFYDALHHAVDEVAALRMVYRALKPGGTCVTSEPGDGHAQHPVSLEAMRKYNVTERDMPPRTIIAAGRQVGFRQFRVYPHAAELGNAIYSYSGRLLHRLAAASPLARKWCGLTSAVRILFYRARRAGIVVLVK